MPADISFSATGSCDPRGQARSLAAREGQTLAGVVWAESNFNHNGRNKAKPAKLEGLDHFQSRIDLTQGPTNMCLLPGSWKTMVESCIGHDKFQLDAQGFFLGVVVCKKKFEPE